MRGEAAGQRAGVVEESMLLFGRALQAMRADAIGRTACGSNMAAGTSSASHHQPTTITIKLPLGGWAAEVTSTRVTQWPWLGTIRVGGSRGVDNPI